MKRRILLVEDNPTNTYLATFVLEQAGFEVGLARNGREALTEARRVRPALVLMDLQMPEMDGYEAATRLLADPETSGIPVVALTAFAMPGDRAKALAMGFSDYIEKPFDPDTLAAQLSRFLAPEPP